MRGGKADQHSDRSKTRAKPRAGSGGVPGHRAPRARRSLGWGTARHGCGRDSGAGWLGTMGPTWNIGRYSQMRSPRPSSLHWSTGESSSTQRSVEPGMRTVFSTRPRPSSSSASIEILRRWRRLGPTSPRSPIGFGSFVTTSKTSRPYWNDSGLRRWQESFSTLEFPPPNSMTRTEVSPTTTEVPSTCEWTQPLRRRPTTW